MLGSFRLLLVGYLLSAGALLESADLEVVRIDFELVNQDGARDPWYEVAIVVSVETGDRLAGANPRFANDIAVSLALATEVNRERGTAYEFYATQIEFPTLEVGQHVVRFYLPPEIVKRDRVRGEPFAFEVEVISGDQLETSLVSRNLQRPNALQRFHSQVVANASASSEMRPQYRTPFAWSYPRDTPNPRLRAE